MDVHGPRPLVILLTPGIGGPHAWARRLQQQLSERDVILLVRSREPVSVGDHDVRTFERARDLGRLVREIGPATYMPNWLWNTYPVLSRLRDRGMDLHVIAHCRSDDDHSYYRPLIRNSEYFDAAFSVSEVCASRLREYLPTKREKIYYVPTFVPRALAPPKRRQKGPLRVLYLGRIEEEHKRVGDLIHISALLTNARVDFTLTVAGDGSRLSELVHNLGEVRHIGRVRLIGPIQPADVSAVIEQHDVILQTSEVEGLSNSLLEAMAAGLVPVATPVGDTSRVIADGWNGLCFQPGDVVAAANALASLADDRQLLGTMGHRAWERTWEFSWDSVGPRLRNALCAVESQSFERAAEHRAITPKNSTP